MAPQAAKAAVNNRGIAAVEAVPTVGILVTFVAALLLGTNLIFSRAWLQYQGEQTLFCLAERHSNFECRTRLKKKLVDALPFGHLGEIRMVDQGDKWKIFLDWKLKNWNVRISKELSSRQILHSKALRW